VSVDVLAEILSWAVATYRHDLAVRSEVPCLNCLLFDFPASNNFWNPASPIPEIVSEAIQGSKVPTPTPE
jgi:hypothetical protein